MKVVPVLIGALALSACVGSAAIEQLKQPEDASGFMVTATDAEVVAQCMGSMLKVQPATVADGYMVRSSSQPGVSYRIVSITDKLERFKTRVDVLGHSTTGDAPNVALCLSPAPPAT